MFFLVKCDGIVVGAPGFKCFEKIIFKVVIVFESGELFSRKNRSYARESSWFLKVFH